MADDVFLMIEPAKFGLGEVEAEPMEAARTAADGTQAPMRSVEKMCVLISCCLVRGMPEAAENGSQALNQL